MNISLRGVIAILAFLMVGSAAAGSGAITMELIQNIEKKLDIPDESNSDDSEIHKHLKQLYWPDPKQDTHMKLAFYTRFYYNTQVNNQNILGATFIHTTLLRAFAPAQSYDAPIKIVTEEQVPYITKSGCKVIYLQYDIENDKVISIKCSDKGAF